MPLIELANVTKTYVNGELSVEVLHGISMSIFRGEFVAIMGSSGSGKTTLMNILGCLDRPTSGQYRFEGQDVAELSPDGLARLRRDAFGFVFQSYNLIPTATALENVQVPAIYAGVPAAERRARAESILDTLGLGERLEHLPSQLSGGQQQRVSIARALMNGGGVILADEPTGALDSRTGAEVMRLLRDLRDRGHTIILITHSREVAECADRVVEIKDGVIVGDSGARIPAEPAVEEPLPRHDDSSMAVFLGEASEAVRIATRALRANVFRTVLTLLGIVIGVGSVIAMLAVGDGAKQAVLQQISKMGSDLLLVRPGARNLRGTAGVVATLEPEDAQMIAAIPNVANAVPERNGTSVLRFGNADYQTQISATTEALPIVRDWPIAHGTFFTAADVQSFGPVIVLGRTVAATLFPADVEPIGRYVLVNNVPFQVIGVMTAKGATQWGSDMDDIAFVPLTTGRLRLFGNRYLSTILVQVEDVSRIDATEQAVNAVFRQQFRTRDFRIRNMAAILDTVEQAQGTLTILLGAIAAISLLVGGIGVMNIMLVSVTERTREIGIRVATGARTANILQQFLTESVVVSAIGGTIGVAGGLAVAWTLGRLGTSVQFSLMPVLLAFGCAFATGVVFGYLPAKKAATVDPVVALSAE